MSLALAGQGPGCSNSTPHYEGVKRQCYPKLKIDPIEDHYPRQRTVWPIMLQHDPEGNIGGDPEPILDFLRSSSVHTETTFSVSNTSTHSMRIGSARGIVRQPHPTGATSPPPCIGSGGATVAWPAKEHFWAPIVKGNGKEDFEVSPLRENYRDL